MLGVCSTAARSFPSRPNPIRITEDINVLDFELSTDEMAAIDGLDTGRRGGPRARRDHAGGVRPRNPVSLRAIAPAATWISRHVEAPHAGQWDALITIGHAQAPTQARAGSGPVLAAPGAVPRQLLKSRPFQSRALRSGSIASSCRGTVLRRVRRAGWSCFTRRGAVQYVRYSPIVPAATADQRVTR